MILFSCNGCILIESKTKGSSAGTQQNTTSLGECVLFTTINAQFFARLPEESVLMVHIYEFLAGNNSFETT